MGRKRLGELLMERGAIGVADLERAFVLASSRGLRLGTAIRELGLVPEGRLVAALAESLDLPVADLAADDLDWTAMHLLRQEFCEAHDLLPIAFEETRGHRALRVAMADPLDVPVIDEIEFTTGFRVRPLVAGRDAIHAAIGKWLRRGRPQPGSADGDRMVVVHAGGLQQLVEGSPGGDDVVPLVEEVEDSRHPSDSVPAQRVPDFRTRASSRRQEVAEDLGYLTGGSESFGDTRLARLELRYERLLHLLGRQGILTADELLKLLE